MAVSKVSQGEIVEVNYLLPSNEFKAHPALVLSSDNLQNNEDGMFYAALISTKQLHPQYIMELKDDWLTTQMPKKSYVVTHIVTFFKINSVIKSYNTSIKKEEFFNKILFKIIDSMFELEITEE